jgi:hypothetical protein
MPSVQIKDVPAETRGAPTARLEGQPVAAGYLRTWLIEEAKQPTIDEVMHRIASDRRVVPLDLATEIVRGP